VASSQAHIPLSRAKQLGNPLQGWQAIFHMTVPLKLRSEMIIAI
jgi:hypothetical protein